jgi:hypothetical protein
MTGDLDPSGSTNSSISSAGLRIASTTPANLTLKNNAISVDLTSNTATLKHYAIVAPSTAYAWGTGGANNNDYYVNAANTQMVLAASLCTPTPKSPHCSWRAVPPNQDAASISAPPGYTSASDLHINTGSGFDDAPPVSNRGTPLASVTGDYDSGGRDAARPDIGADEFIVDRLALAGPGGLAPSGSLYGNYDTVTLASGVITTSGDLDFHGNLTIGGGSTLDMGYYLATWDGTYTIQPTGVSIEQYAVSSAGEHVFNLAEITNTVSVSGTLSNLLVAHRERAQRASYLATKRY